jgi:2-polyprenyl-3-methyl-5-hydroxy-6-metoxy-1,4-benzoquinol methylase
MQHSLKQIRILAKKAGVPIHKTAIKSTLQVQKAADEEDLSDTWAMSVNPTSIDIVQTNTACTSPELRYIHKTLQNVKGKQILDIGCGLGEVSVYLATRGARVTALDLSQPMLDVAKTLAKQHNVRIKTIHASIEDISSLPGHSFDVVYVGNLFHHVDIRKALEAVRHVLKPDGTLVCWEPVQYNPVINIYRRIARRVRSDNERPFTLSDIQLFRSYFRSVSLGWYWLTTLIIFVIMATVYGRNPNKIRYWKAVVSEEARWRPLYVPLEKLDTFLIRIFPFLAYLCWNVVIVGTGLRLRRAR